MVVEVTKEAHVLIAVNERLNLLVVGPKVGHGGVDALEACIFGLGVECYSLESGGAMVT